MKLSASLSRHARFELMNSKLIMLFSVCTNPSKHGLKSLYWYQGLAVSANGF